MDTKKYALCWEGDESFLKAIAVPPKMLTYTILRTNRNVPIEECDDPNDVELGRVEIAGKVYQVQDMYVLIITLNVLLTESKHSAHFEFLADAKDYAEKHYAHLCEVMEKHLKV